jgi:hypothetical protein
VTRRCPTSGKQLRQTMGGSFLKMWFVASPQICEEMVRRW